MALKKSRKKKTLPAKRTASRSDPKAAPPQAGAPFGVLPGSPFYIVAIGASAGGLEAFEQFFRNMPEDSNMAFVLIPHLSPEHKSIMPELLSHYSKMRIVQAEDGERVKTNSLQRKKSNSTR
jgi:chemotaxis response regulator CheB